MRNQFSTRDELVEYLRGEFADVCCDDRFSQTRGGRIELTQLLSRVDPKAYARTRNNLDGTVTRLSPFIRHGVTSLAEVRRFVLDLIETPDEAAKLINELGWRDYWRRVYGQIGERVWTDLEAIKTGHAGADYADALPRDLSEASTGLACIDAAARDLLETGYVHNHARMWLAAYVVHFRRIKWQAGAKWFLQHLLDGDVASNNLSWQWVASTFSGKPYFMNRENIERFTGGRFCEDCPGRRACPFDASYESLAAKLFFVPGDSAPAEKLRLRAEADTDHEENVSHESEAPGIAWIHHESIGVQSPAAMAVDASRRIWVWDDEQLRRDRPSLKRIVFQTECVLETGATIVRGSWVSSLIEFANARSTKSILTTASPDRPFRRTCEDLAKSGYDVRVLPVEAFVTLRSPVDLGRFSRYWGKAERAAMHIVEKQRRACDDSPII